MAEVLNYQLVFVVRSGLLEVVLWESVLDDELQLRHPTQEYMAVLEEHPRALVHGLQDLFLSDISLSLS